MQMFYWSAKQNHVTCGCMTPIPNWKLHQNKTILEFTLCFSVSKECHVKTMLATNVFYFGYHICCCVHLNDFQRCVFLTNLVTWPTGTWNFISRSLKIGKWSRRSKFPTYHYILWENKVFDDPNERQKYF